MAGGGQAMKTLNFSILALQLRLWLQRFGWSNGVAVFLLALGGAVWLWGIPLLNAQTVSLQRALQDTQKALDNAPLVVAAPALSQSELRLHNFYDALGATRHVAQQVRTLFAIAAKNGLTLKQAEYKFAYDKNGRFHTYSILLPVNGPYAAIRPFCEEVLLAIPFASLDNVNFKREAIANSTIEANLHFTLHLDDPVGLGSGIGDGPAPSDVDQGGES
jgi:hypothetical protein